MTAEQQAQVEALHEHMRKLRVSYGYPADPPLPLSLEEMKEGERRNAARAIAEVLKEHGGSNAGEEPWRPWYARPTHNRDLPSYAHHTIEHDCWTPEATRNLALRAWSQPEWPGQYPASDWRDMFTRVTDLPLCSEVEDSDGEESCPVPQLRPQPHREGRTQAQPPTLRPTRQPRRHSPHRTHRGRHPRRGDRPRK